MKKLLLALATGVLLLSPASAQTPSEKPAAAQANPPQAELKALIDKVQTKLKEGKRTEAELASELKEFDALAAKNSEEVASQVMFMKATLYIQALREPAKGVAVLEQIKTKYPNTKIAGQVGEIIASIQQQAEAGKTNNALTVGATFPPFEVKDLNGKPLSIAGMKAKVILIDFWATWCGPCVKELPSVLATYDKFHGKGFDIIGISLDEQEAALTAFLKEHKMPWPQFFDGLGWQNALAKKYGINSIPATFLVDGSGKILARDLRGAELEAAVAKALGAN